VWSDHAAAGAASASAASKATRQRANARGRRFVARSERARKLRCGASAPHCEEAGQVLLVAADLFEQRFLRRRGDLERFECLAQRRVVLVAHTVDADRDRVRRDQQPTQRRRHVGRRCVVGLDRFAQVGGELHDRQRGRTHLGVRHAELLALGVDQQHRRVVGEPLEDGVIASRRPAEDERRADVVEQTGAERVVRLHADPAGER
jgi:hypothetical protein